MGVHFLSLESSPTTWMGRLFQSMGGLYICLHFTIEKPAFHVGEYTSAMDGMGMELLLPKTRCFFSRFGG